MLSSVKKIVFLMVAMWALPASGDFITIAQPDSTYVNNTTLISLTGIANGMTNITSITNGTQTLQFSQPQEKAAVGSGWATWGAPPFTESNNPQLLFKSNYETLVIDLQLASTTFGVELQGNNFSTEIFSVNFLDASSTVVGTVTQSVNGSSGARLFAASTNTNPFTRIRINAPFAAGGFAMAQFRYTVAAVPEPASYAIMAQALLGAGYFRYRRNRRRAAI